MSQKPTLATYAIPANVMQAIVSVVMAQPAGQVMDLALALRQTCAEQEKAFEQAAAAPAVE